MAESIRAILADTDAVMACVRTRLAGTNVSPDGAPIHGDFVTAPIDDDTATALRLADQWADAVEQLAYEHRLAALSHEFRAQWPALVRWRDGVLSSQRKAKPATVAAAYELLALECTLAGELHLAAKAQQAAIDVMRRRGVVPIRPETSVSGEQAQSA